MTLASIAAGADGIMLEVHPDPENSAVDPLQPIDYEEFKNLYESMNKVAEAVGKSIAKVKILNLIENKLIIEKRNLST